MSLLMQVLERAEARQASRRQRTPTNAGVVGSVGRRPNATGVGDITYALVGIAGSFIGFHLGVILGLLPTPLMLYLAAVAGAAITIWLWRGR